MDDGRYDHLQTHGRGYFHVLGCGPHAKNYSDQGAGRCWQIAKECQ